jgi:hypothetical protein
LKAWQAAKKHIKAITSNKKKEKRKESGLQKGLKKMATHKDVLESSNKVIKLTSTHITDLQPGDCKSNTCKGEL